MLHLNSIKWKNFLSTGNAYTQINLDKNKSTLISGNNGSGKSTLLDAITFCLYGKPFRSIKTSSLTNSINLRGCVCEVDFTVGGHSYKVIRGLNPRQFDIYKDAQLIPQQATVKDHQEYLESQVLKMSYKAFCQVIILGSSNYIPFMRLASKDRKVIVEDLLDINVFSDMNGALKTRLSSSKERISELSGKVRLKEGETEATRKIIDGMASFSESAKAKQREEIQGYQNKKEILLAEIRDHDRDLLGIKEEEEMKRRDAEDYMRVLQFKDKIQKRLSKQEDIKKRIQESEVCPLCNQPLNDPSHHTHIHEQYESKIAELQKGLDDIGGKLIALKPAFESHEKTVQRMDEVASDRSGKASEVGILERMISQSTSKLAQSESVDVSKEREQLIVLEGELAQLKSELDEALVERDDLDQVAVLLKDSGIKSKIIKHYLPVMNNLINKHLARMDFFCLFNIDENFDETIKSRHRDAFSYNNFSEGEKLRIDLSILMAWREVARLKNSVSCNLLLLDEVFDSSLDASGMEEAMKIIEEMDSRTNIFVISHKSEQLVDKFKNHLHFEKKGDFSTMVFTSHK